MIEDFGDCDMGVNNTNPEDYDHSNNNSNFYNNTYEMSIIPVNYGTNIISV